MNEAEFTDTLDALEGVLTREFRALTILDGDAIERITAEKESLTEKLRALLPPSADRLPVKGALLRIKSSAQVNQALMVHARACIAGALRIATGAFAEPVSYGPTKEPQSGAHAPASTPPIRVNIKG